MARMWHGDSLLELLGALQFWHTRASCALAQVSFLIIPSAIDPPVRGASQARVVKVERPAGRMTLTTRAWLLGLPGSMAGGMISSTPASHHAAPGLTIIPESERPRRRPRTSDAYRVKVPVETSRRRDNRYQVVLGAPALDAAGASLGKNIAMEFCSTSTAFSGGISTLGSSGIPSILILFCAA